MKLNVNYANRPPGDKIIIPGLGELINGQSIDITDEQIAAAANLGFTIPADGNVGVAAVSEAKTEGTTDPFWDRKSSVEEVAPIATPSITPNITTTPPTSDVTALEAEDVRIQAEIAAAKAAQGGEGQ